MQATPLAYTYGWIWVFQGWTLFKRQPMAMLFWSLMTSLFLNVSYIIPLIGQIAFIVATPAIGFIALNACVHIERNQLIQLSMWLAPLKKPGVKPALIKLGVWYFLVCLAAALIAILPYANGIMEALATEHIEAEHLAKLIQKPMMLFGILYIGIAILFWHAPALMGWHLIPLKKALFYSMVACWRTKWALILFVAFWALLYMLSHQVVLLGVQVLGESWAYFLLTPINLIMMAVLYSCFYPIYRSVFGSYQANATHSV